MAHKPKKHHRKAHHPLPKVPAPAPMPGPHEFSADEEKAMRSGQRAERMPPEPLNDGDEDDMEMA